MSIETVFGVVAITIPFVLCGRCFGPTFRHAASATKASRAARIIDRVNSARHLCLLEREAEMPRRCYKDDDCAPKSIRRCPICGVAMLASKSRPDSLAFDTFDCLRCDTVISVAPVRAAPEPTGTGSE